MLRRHSRVGGFELLRQIGAGGQAEVYLARPAGGGWRSGRAALKLARPEHSAGLHDEHGWLAGPGGEHPGLPQLFSRRYGGPGDLGYVDLPNTDRLPFLALAYLPGQTLERLLARRHGRGLPTRLAIHIALQAAVTLDHLHRRVGIVHHDVRPANLLIGPGRMPQVTLLDLGAAESLCAPRRLRVYGVRSYLPPERLAGAVASPLADVYSLGVTLRAMLGQQVAAPALSDLIGAATEADPQRRARALPDMAALVERLNSTRW